MDRENLLRKRHAVAEDYFKKSLAAVVFRWLSAEEDPFKVPSLEEVRIALVEYGLPEKFIDIDLLKLGGLEVIREEVRILIAEENLEII